MARDVRSLRAEAAEATSAGKYKRALAAYLELERLEPRDAQWSKRAAETYRRLNKHKDAVEAYSRAVERYAQGGFLVQAIAVCKVILQLEPKNDEALRQLAQMNEQVGAGPSRVISLAESNPNLHSNEAVARLRSGATGKFPAYTDGPPAIARKVTPQNLAMKVPPQDLAQGDRRRNPGSTPPPIAVSRTKSKPINLEPDQAIESISLKDEVPDSFEREENSGVYVIPLDGRLDEFPEQEESTPIIEIEEPDPIQELNLADIEEIPLPEPRIVGVRAAEALASTPLFAGLSQEALGSLVQQLTLVHLGSDETLFREGDPGDALYVIVEGEVAVQAEGPPRVEMARLGAGSFIGEVALMTDQPRSATVTATADAELLRIDRKTLSYVLATHGEVLAAVLRFVRDRLVDRWTRTSPLFRPFDAEQRAEIASRFNFLEIERGSTLLSAGRKPDGLYIVLAGKFQVRRDGSAVAQVGPGELIGETALLSGDSFKSEVVATGKSLALCLPASDFKELISSHPQVLEYLGTAAEHSRKLQIL